MDRYADKVALVTGAASGIGRQTALRLASEGATVYGADVDEAGLEQTAKQVEQGGGRMRFGRHDLTSREACFASVAETVAAFEKLDVLCNVAGVSQFHHFEQMDEQQWRFMLDLNLSAVAFMCQAAIPHLLERDGAIVNVASVAGRVGQAYTVAYCAAKGGVIMLTQALAAEYIRTGLRVNAVAPGGVKTPLNSKLRFPEDLDWKLVNRYMGWRGLCEPEEIAAAIAYLGCDEARFVNGAVLSIDGGVAAT